MLTHYDGATLSETFHLIRKIKSQTFIFRRVVEIRAVEHFVTLYFGIGLTNKGILDPLAHQHHIVIR